MRLIVIREAQDSRAGAEPGLLRYALATSPLMRVVLNGLYPLWCWNEGDIRSSRWIEATTPETTVWAFPEGWPVPLPGDLGRVLPQTAAADIGPGAWSETPVSPWCVISSGRYATRIHDPLLEAVVSEAAADVVAITASSDLLAYRERVRLAGQNELVGYRRLYEDSAEPMPMPEVWPHHLFVKREVVKTVLADGLPGTFDAFVRKCRSHGLKLRASAVAGSVLDLESETGLLALSGQVLAHMSLPAGAASGRNGQRVSGAEGNGAISRESRFIGPVLLGDHVCIEPEAIVIGPAILCDNSTVRQGAVVDGAILGTGAVIESDQVLRRSVVVTPESPSETPCSTGSGAGWFPLRAERPKPTGVFRSWPRFSYVGCYKRIVDATVAAFVLVLFAPVIPLIALAIKISSPGPVFFKHRRQGLHGRPFDCIKFRTMSVGAADIQDKLRFVSDVDGPQFKMEDDPRISTVGRFLRETYLDEVPQFLNVLCGQMSIVGPRPSPESENTLCPSWRDARLSVRPGITGLWQVFRTRQPMKDFQEWIHYDTKYVRELSPRLDFWICWQTFKKMVDNFISQF